MLQLFSEIPDDDTLAQLFRAFGLPFPIIEDIRLDPWVLREADIIPKIQELIPVLSLFYIPCKAKIYLYRDLKLKNAITILRQFCRVKGYSTKIAEIQINNRKMRTFIISPPISQIIRTNRQISFD